MSTLQFFLIPTLKRVSKNMKKRNQLKLTRLYITSIARNWN